MSRSRRFFIQRSFAAAAAVTTGTFDWCSADLTDLLHNVKSFGEGQNVTSNEDFWHMIRQSYTVSANIMNLNNGGVCPQPRVVQEAVERYNRLSNEAPSYYMWRILDQGREAVRDKLALLAGCSSDELAINRNSSEALETVIFGLTLKAGDEVVLSKQDYPNMINAWKQREHRDGVILKWVDLELPSEDDDYLVSMYKEQITERTKLVHITQLINWNGQVLPVRKLVDLAHENGAETLVDGAHAFAHLDFTIEDLDCDYYGTSLHKWLCAPFGTGMLYVKQDKIAGLYPLFGSPDPESADIRKFEHLGTRSFAIEQAVGQAADFHNMIGTARKFERLHYLKNYWSNGASSLEGLSVGTSLDPLYGGAIGLLQVEGKEPRELGNFLFRNYKIHTTSITWENIKGVRITPNVYTLKSDMDRLLEALQEFVKV